MFMGTTGWLVLLLYVLVIVAIILAAIAGIRWAVLSALKAHTRWVDSGKP